METDAANGGSLMRTGRFLDLNQTFSYEISPLRRETKADVYTVSFPSAPCADASGNGLVSGELFLPQSSAEDRHAVPVVIILHMFSANFSLIRPVCRRLCKEGVAAFMLYLPHAGPRAQGNARRRLRRDTLFFLNMFQQACGDTDRACQIFLQQPEFSRVDLMGVSLGGLIAATTAGKNALFSRIMLLLAGGDLRGIMKQAFLVRHMARAFEEAPDKEREELLQGLHEIEPLLYAGGMKERAEAGNVLMVNGAYDRVIPPANALMLAATIGLPDPGCHSVLRNTLLNGSAFRLASTSLAANGMTCAPSCAEPLHWLASGHYSALLYMPKLLNLTADFFSTP